MSRELSTNLSEVFSEGPPEAPEGKQLDIKRLIRLRAPLMIGVFLILAVPSVLGAYFLTPMEYTASQNIRFLSNQPRVLYDRGQDTQYDKFVNTQVNLIAGTEIMSRVLREQRIQSLEVIKTAPDPLQYLQSHVSARPIWGSELVTVSCTSGDREAAKAIVEVTIEQYMQYANIEDNNLESDRLRTLRQEEQARSDEYDRLRRQIADLQRQLEIPTANMPNYGPSEASLLREQLFAAQKEFSIAERDLLAAQKRHDAMLELQKDFDAAPHEPIYTADVELYVSQAAERLRNQITESETNLALSRNNYREGHPELKRREDVLEVLRKELKEEEVKARRTYVTGLVRNAGEAVRNAEAALAEIAERRDELQLRLAEHEDKLKNTAEQFSELNELQNRANDARRVLDEARRNITMILVEKNAPARVSQVGRADAPAFPDHGRRKKLMLLAFMGSMCAGAGLGLLRELTDQQVRSAQDVAAITRLPILACIPHAREDAALPGEAHHLIAAEYPDSPTIDEIRRVVTRIIYPPESASELNTCLVSSPTRGDGKTTLACNLAVLLANAGRRVLLIDISAREPRVEKAFGLEPGAGLAEILSGDHAPYDLTRPTMFDKLYVLGPGHNRRGLSAKLGSREMLELLERAEHDFEHVIIDSPPALLMSEAKFLAPIADGVILVVGVGKSTMGMVQRCLREMNQVGANVAGIVLNGIRFTRGGYLRQNIRMFYDYTARDGNGKHAADVADVVLIDDEDLDAEAHPAVVLVDDEPGDETEQDASR